MARQVFEKKEETNIRHVGVPMSDEDKRFLSNFADYLSILRFNKWPITMETFKEAARQYEEKHGKMQDEFLYAMSMILFPYAKEAGWHKNEKV